ncbi:glycosyl hydrolase family 76-domain-containing protein [Thermothelomyces heterothallicus CBS 202.75]|uniref:glycosyl hydrolase family 76-domain-containing protein n=1 Tax=Thermothelomyces heterothallicus CBS 202.75 TaxID=1149848 RepID=UPI00374320EA
MRCKMGLDAIHSTVRDGLSSSLLCSSRRGLEAKAPSIMKPRLFLTILGWFSQSWLAQGVARRIDTQHEAVEAVEAAPEPYSDAAATGPSPSETRYLQPRLHLDIRAAARSAIEAMNKKFYSSAQAIWSPGDPWWLSGVALTTVIDYMRKTGTGDYLGQVENIIRVQRTQHPQNGGEFRADSTDDTGWCKQESGRSAPWMPFWESPCDPETVTLLRECPGHAQRRSLFWLTSLTGGLAMIRMYDLTGDSTYLSISTEDETFMYKHWTSSPCGGGIYVDTKTKTYKNAIANELYIKLAASLHNRIANDTKYLSRAETAWTWFQRSGMIKGDSLINDGLAASSNGACYNNELPVWTYNQGVILGALVELYRATSSETYLTSARAIADAVLSNDGSTNPQLSSPYDGEGGGGILTEASCKPDEPDGCNHDQQVFKGVLAYNLAELDAAVPDGSRPYRAYLERNAQSAYVNAREQATDLYDVGWAGPPFRDSTIGKQASAVGLLVAVV